MSKNLVLKGLSFVRKGQGGKTTSVDTSGKASEGAAPFTASRGGKKGSKSKLKGDPHVPAEGRVSHGKISKPAKPKRSSEGELLKEVAQRHELKSMCILYYQSGYNSAQQECAAYPLPTLKVCTSCWANIHFLLECLRLTITESCLQLGHAMLCTGHP